MNAKVEAFLAQKQQEEEKTKKIYRERVLKEAGLYTKEYAQGDYDADDYPHYDYDEMRRYKLVYDEVTEEEFALVERHVTLDTKEDEDEHTMFSNIGEKIQSVAWFAFWAGLLASIFAGILMMAPGDEMILYGLITACVGGVGSWLTSLFLSGIGEVIIKLTQIEKNTRK